MIEVSHLTKRYGEKYAVNDISFTINKGEIVGFLGPNGAGKSTTMNILTGYLSSNDGTVKVAGYDVLDEPDQAKKHIGFLPEQPPLYVDMTVKEYLSFIYDLKKVKLNKKAHIEEICRLVRISDVYERLIKNLSKGYRQRVGLAQALIGNPDVLVLDEPTVGLDPKQIIEIRSLIKHLGKKHTVILSSHILPEVQSVCERIIIISHGEIVADDTAIGLSHMISNEHKLSVRIAGPAETAQRAITGISGVKTVINLGSKEEGSCDFEIETAPGADIRRPLFNVMSDRRWPILALNTGDLTLEEIFLRMTGDDSSRFAKKRKAQIKAEEEMQETSSQDKESKDVDTDKSEEVDKEKASSADVSADAGTGSDDNKGKGAE